MKHPPPPKKRIVLLKIFWVVWRIFWIFSQQDSSEWSASDQFGWLPPSYQPSLLLQCAVQWYSQPKDGRRSSSDPSLCVFEAGRPQQASDADVCAESRCDRICSAGHPSGHPWMSAPAPGSALELLLSGGLQQTAFPDHHPQQGWELWVKRNLAVNDLELFKTCLSSI